MDYTGEMHKQIWSKNAGWKKKIANSKTLVEKTKQNVNRTTSNKYGDAPVEVLLKLQLNIDLLFSYSVGLATYMTIFY